MSSKKKKNETSPFAMPTEIVAELRMRAAIEQVGGTIFERAADEIEKLRDDIKRKTMENGEGWRQRSLYLKAELDRYKRMYARSCCRDLYSSGAIWKISPNPMRTDGVFVVEDCEAGTGRTHYPFPVQFDRDVAEEIVGLLNRATKEMEMPR